jgi:hypothetical protein
MKFGPTAVEADANPPRLLSEVTVALDTVRSRAVPPLLVIDDAHLLTDTILITLDNLLARAPRLKILLVGRHGLQFARDGRAARVVTAQKPRQIHLSALDACGTKAYVEHRLKAAGGGRELFTADALTMIFQHAGGSARLINVLCDTALHTACLKTSGRVNAAEILAATQDSRWPEALAREPVHPDELPNVDPPADTTAVATLLVSHRKEYIAAWPLEAGRISIGRADDNEMRLDAPFISRHHCRIVTVGTVSTVEDMDSVNGIALNGRLVKRHLLRHADQIVIGEHVLTYVVS